jgi:rare lipoprotein A
MSAILKRAHRLGVLLLAGSTLCACATPHPRLANHSPTVHAPSGAGGSYKVGEPYQVAGVWYLPREQPDYDVTGMASWYGDAFNQKPTANGEIFDMGAISGAHTTLPLPSMVEVTNLDNGRKLLVRVNDRGPFVDGRVIDLSHAAARELGYDQRGLAHVRVRYVGPAAAPDSSLRYAANTGGPPPARRAIFDVLPPAHVSSPAYTRPVAMASAPPTVAMTPPAVSSSVLPPALPAPQSLPVASPPESAPAQMASRSAQASPSSDGPCSTTR